MNYFISELSMNWDKLHDPLSVRNLLTYGLNHRKHISHITGHVSYREDRAIYELRTITYHLTILISQ